MLLALGYHVNVSNCNSGHQLEKNTYQIAGKGNLEVQTLHGPYTSKALASLDAGVYGKPMPTFGRNLENLIFLNT